MVGADEQPGTFSIQAHQADALPLTKKGEKIDHRRAGRRGKRGIACFPYLESGKEKGGRPEGGNRLGEKGLSFTEMMDPRKPERLH